jgi:hypothetical protein
MPVLCRISIHDYVFMHGHTLPMKCLNSIVRQHNTIDSATCYTILTVRTKGKEANFTKTDTSHSYIGCKPSDLNEIFLRTQSRRNPASTDIF